MKSKTIRNLLTVFILVLGITCCFIPFLNSKNPTAQAADLNPSLMILDDNIPVTFFTGTQFKEKDFVKDGDNIMLSKEERIVLTLNPSNITAPETGLVVVDKNGNETTLPETYGSLRTVSSIDATVQVDADTTYRIDFDTPQSLITATGNTNRGPEYKIAIDQSSTNNVYLNGIQSGTLSEHIAGYYTITFYYNTATANNVSYTLHFTVFEEETFTEKKGSAITIDNVGDPISSQTETEGSITYNQAYAYNFNQIDDGARVYPTLKVVKPTAFGVSFTRIFNSKATEYKFRSISGDTIYYDMINSAGVTTQTSFNLTEVEGEDKTEKHFILPLTEFGEYFFTVDYLNNGSIIKLPENDTGKGYESKSLVIFGFKATYTDADGVKQELYKNDETYSSWANTSSSLRWLTPADSDPEIKTISFNNEIGTDGIPTTNLTPIKFEYLGKLTGSEVKVNNLTSTDYTYGASYSSAGTYEIKINYTYTFQEKQLTGSQTFRFKIDLTAPNSIFATKSSATEIQNITISNNSFSFDGKTFDYTPAQATVDDSLKDGDNVTVTRISEKTFTYKTYTFVINADTTNVSARPNEYTPFSQKYTNKDIYLLTEYNTNPFMSYVGVDYDYYANYGTSKTNLVLQQQGQTTVNEKVYNIFSTATAAPSISRSNNGRYEIHFTFGEKLNQLVDKRELFIDSTPISGIELKEIGYNGTSVNIQDGSLGTALTTLTNKSFGYQWNEKQTETLSYGVGRSGAKTWVTYRYIEISRAISEIAENERLQNLANGDIGILNNYILNAVRDETTNKDLCANLKKGATTNNTFNNADMGVYIFYFADEAENTTTRVVLADNTTPYVLQESLTSTPTVRTAERTFEDNGYTFTINSGITSVAATQNITISANSFSFDGKTFVYTPAQEAGEGQDAVDDSLTYDNNVTVTRTAAGTFTYGNYTLVINGGNVAVTQNITISANSFSLNGTTFTYAPATGENVESLVKIDILSPSYDPTETLNVQTTDTVLTWGDYKLLNISEDVKTFLNENTPIRTLLNSYITTANDFIAIPISSIAYAKIGTTGLAGTNGTISTANKNIALYTSSRRPALPGVYSTGAFVGEGTYDFIINANNTSDTVYNRQVIISNDRSEGRFIAETSATDDDAIKNQLFELMTGSATRLQQLSFSFKNTAEVTVKAVLVDFYPFVDSGDDYPFSTEPTSRQVIYYIDGAVYSSVYYNGKEYTFPTNYSSTSNESTITTGIINAIDGISQPGKYVLTRIYTTTTNDNPLTNQQGIPLTGDATATTATEDDGIIREYFMFVDRNDIVSSDLGKAGQNIRLVLANGDSTENITFKNWGRNTDAGVLTTNKIPVMIYIPYNKYFGGQNLAYTNLIINVTFKPTATTQSTRTYSANANNIVRVEGVDYFAISLGTETDNFRQAGSYEITISDGTSNTKKVSSTDSITSPANTMSFKFTIAHIAPQATLVVKEGNSLSNATLVGDSYYTNIKSDANNALYFTVTDPADPYAARIKTVTIDGTVYALPESTKDDYTSDDLISKIDVTTLAESLFEGNTYTQNSYKIYLNYSTDKTYTVKFSYLAEGQNNIYLVNNNDFSSVTYKVVLDRQRPDTNIDSLINNDTYLNQLFTGTLTSDTFKEWADTNDEANINNYVFYVGETTTLTKEANEFDNFYVRPFSLTNDKLCLTPDSAIYNDASQQNGHPQFSENEYLLALLRFEEFNYGNGTLAEQITDKFSGAEQTNPISGWYEIVERDYAGNYRNYIIYLNIQDEETNIYELGLSQGGTTSILGTQTEENTYLYNLSVDSVSSKLAWCSLKITNLSNNVTDTFVWKPTTNSTINDYVERLKGFLNSATTNTRFRLDFNGAYNHTCYINLLKEHVQIAVPQLETTTIGDGTTYRLKFPTASSSSATYLVGIEVISNNTVIASFGPKFNVLFPSDMTYTLPSKGVYTVRYYDNWTQTANAADTGYDYYMVVGEVDIPDSQRYIYSGNTVTKDKLTFTNDDVTVQFNSEIHSVQVFVNGSTTSTSFTASTGANGYKYIVLPKAAFDVSDLTQASGGEIKYTVKYYSGNNEISAMTKEIVIFNRISGFVIKDSSGQTLDFTTTGTNQTSQIVQVSWDELATEYSSDVNNFQATLYFLGTTFGSQYFKDGQITSYGNYRLTLENLDLGYSRDLIFRIIEKDSNLYSVELNGTPLEASPLTLDITSNTNNILTTLKAKIANMPETEIPSTVKTKITSDLINVELKQYFSNDTSIDIVTNTDNSLSRLYFTFVNGTYNNCYPTKHYEEAWANSYVTYIVLVYGTSNPIYEELVSMTIVPYTSEFKNETGDLLLFNLVNRAGGFTPLAGTNYKELTSEIIENSTATLIWKKSALSGWYAAGNITYMSYSYASQTNPTVYGTTYGNEGSEKSYYKAVISGAGNHTVSFKDWAGNQHRFSLTSQTYTLSLLDSVVYKINNRAPIQYAIYNGNVQLDIDPAFISKYMPNSLSVAIRRNGNLIDINSTDPGFAVNNYTYVFSKSGRYEVTITAQYRGGRQLNEAVYNFSIIDPTSARLAWEFNEIDGYEIVKILKDGLDITETVANGSAIRKMFISTSTSEWGIGSYTVYIKSKTTDVLEGQTFGFSFKIRNEVPVIVSSPEYGGTTKGTITLQYNRAQIFDLIGKSELRILTYDSKSSTFKSFGTISITNEQVDSNAISTISLNQTNDYYIQLVTDNGNVVLSFRVNRQEPLNTLAIIIIVISAAAVIILTIVFIKLRTKMKIR